MRTFTRNISPLIWIFILFFVTRALGPAGSLAFVTLSGLILLLLNARNAAKTAYESQVVSHLRDMIDYH